MKPRSNKTQYTITIDTEEEWDWNSRFTTHAQSVKNIEGVRRFQDCCEDLNARTTYFVNYAVLDSDWAANEIVSLSKSEGVEIGYHIHPWNTPPLAATPTVPVRDSFLHSLDPDIAIKKVDTTLLAFANNGLAPTSFRGGRYSTSDFIQDHLYANGIIADASILPFTTWPDDGAPDFRRRDLTPRRRAMGDAKTGLWEIPLTLAYTRAPWRLWRRMYEIGEKPPLRQMRFIGIAEKFFLKRIWLNLEHPLGERLDLLLPVLRKENLPCINFTLHSSSLVPGLNPYTRTKSDLERVYERLRRAIAILNRWPEFEPATVTEVAQTLEKNYRENYRD